MGALIVVGLIAVVIVIVVRRFKDIMDGLAGDDE